MLWNTSLTHAPRDMVGVGEAREAWLDEAGWSCGLATHGLYSLTWRYLDSSDAI